MIYPGKTVLMLLLILLTAVPLFAQPGNLFIRNFPLEDYQDFVYGSSPQNWDVIEDQRGIIYVANSSALMEFDGTQWGGIENEDALYLGSENLVMDTKGRIFLGGKDNFGYLGADAVGQTVFYPLKELLASKDSSFEVLKTDVVHDTVFFIAKNFLLLYDQHRISKLELPGDFRASWLLDDELCFQTDKGIYHIVKGKILTWPFSIPGNPDIVTMFRIKDKKSGENKLMVVTADKGVFLFDAKGKMLSVALSIGSPIHIRINAAIRLSAGPVALATETEGVFFISESGSLLKKVNKISGLNDNQVNGLFEDKHHGIWAALSSGLSRIEYPASVSFIDYSNGLDGTVLAICRVNDMLYAGTTNGFYQASLNEDFIRVSRLGEISGKVWVVKQMPDGIWVGCGDSLLVYDGKHFKNILSKGVSCILHDTLHAEYVFLGLEDGIGIMQQPNGQAWKLMGMINGITSDIKTLQFDSVGRLWAGGYGCGFLINFQGTINLNPEVIALDKSHGWRDELVVLEVSKVRNKIYFGTWKGTYSYNEKLKQISQDSSFGKLLAAHTREASVISEDRRGNILVHSEKRTGIVRYMNGTVTWDTVPLARLPVAGVWSIFCDARNYIWIGSEKGIFVYNPAHDSGQPLDFNCFIRSVKLNGDSTIFFGSFTNTAGYFTNAPPHVPAIRIPYELNDIAFRFSAATYNAKESPEYSFILEGRNTNWSEWSTATQKEFTNLHEGEYKFKVKSRNLYGIESSESVFEFVILPPWYRTWWAYLAYILLGYLAIVAIVRINVWRYKEAKLRLESTVKERTSQVLHQKEVIELEKQKVENKSAELEKTLDDLKQAQSHLVQSEKMASLGQLTAGIAHELNNPINFISGNVTPLRNDIGELLDLINKYDAVIDQKRNDEAMQPLIKLREHADLKLIVDEIGKLLSGIDEGARRTTEIVKGLRNFSRTDESELKMTQLNDALDSTLTILQNKTKGRIEIVKSYGDLPLVECYPGQLNQVFLNILNNAIQAIPAQGKITIATRVSNNQVIVSIKDTGKGMTDEIKQHIFDPFFTTKQVGEGTGLGLSISYGIIEKHDGKIEVKSEPGAGTEFIILLPLQQNK